MKKLYAIIIILLVSICGNSQDKEVFDWLPEQKMAKIHAIGLNVPIYSNDYQVYNLYYELLSFEGEAGFQFPIKYMSDSYFTNDGLIFRGIFLGCDFVHHVTNHYSKWQFFYGGGVHPGYFIWDATKPGPYKRQGAFSAYLDIKLEFYYMFTQSFGLGIYGENGWILRLDGYKQNAPENLQGGGTMNFGAKAIYRFNFK